MARALRDRLRYGRGEQHILSAAGSADLRRVVSARAARIPVRRQGEPLPDPHEEAEGSGGRARAVSFARKESRAGVRAHPLSIAATMAADADESRPPRYFSEGAQPAPAPHDRVSRSELVRRGRAATTRPSSR